MPWLINLFSSLGTVFSTFLASNARVIFKMALISSFVVALTNFSIFFVDFAGDVYYMISTASSSALHSNLPKLLGCVISTLGVNQFVTSAFSIFFSASAFWLIAVAYIISFKLGLKAYDGLFKALT